MNTQADYIFIEELKLNAIIGIHPWEKVQTQPLIFDLKLLSETTTASGSQQLADTTDYKQVCDDIEDWINKNPTDLLETLAEDLCKLVFNNHPKVEQIQLKIRKPHAIAQAKAAGLQIVRNRSAQ